MKKVELKKLVAEYKELMVRAKKNKKQNLKISDKIEELKHRYFHETGKNIEND